jgi:hypothetical protein
MFNVPQTQSRTSLSGTLGDVSTSAITSGSRPVSAASLRETTLHGTCCSRTVGKCLNLFDPRMRAGLANTVIWCGRGCWVKGAFSVARDEAIDATWLLGLPRRRGEADRGRASIREPVIWTKIVLVMASGCRRSSLMSSSVRATLAFDWNENWPHRGSAKHRSTDSGSCT